MPRHRQVGTTCDLSVRTVGAGVYSMFAIPLIAAGIAGSAWLHQRNADASAMVAPPGIDSKLASSDESASRASSSALAWLAEPVTDAQRGTSAAARIQTPVLKLSPEQQKIAQFVAKKYRVAVDDVQHFVVHAYRAAREFRLDPYLVLAVMSIESNFDPNARSSKGAQGLMQVLTRVHVDKFAPFGGVHAAFDPVANISVGSRILRDYLVREGHDVEAALKSYVGAALLSHDFGYGYKVLSERERIAAAAAGKPIPTRPLEPPLPQTAPQPARVVPVVTELPDPTFDAAIQDYPSMPTNGGGAPTDAALESPGGEFAQARDTGTTAAIDRRYGAGATDAWHYPTEL
jgi:hypothetical protein